MSKIVRINCQSRRITVEDMTGVEETRRTADIAAEAILIQDAASARTQRQQDITLVMAGPAAPGYAAALLRLIGASPSAQGSEGTR